MSKAGIQSNRGDGYQTLVAIEWALSVLTDPNYAWIEIDSVTWPVDDVVVGRTDGSIICCQCKKNQKHHKSWPLSDLEDELRKAISLFNSTPRSEVWFYSRTAFGDLAALREFSKNFHSENSFKVNLTDIHSKTDARIEALLKEENSDLTSYQFLKRINFENSSELERMAEKLNESLRLVATHSSAAFEALWYRLDSLGMRLGDSDSSSETQHRLTKQELKLVLKQSGSVLAPPFSTEEILSNFQSTSSVGRVWKTDIGGEHLTNPTVDMLIDFIKLKHRSILLTGKPGSGKTCVMLEVQEALERIAQCTRELVPLFIQSREFADAATAHDRNAHGLSENLVSEAARLAETEHVIILIDSLDVLSIARDHTVLAYFLSLIDRLLVIPGVTVVTACRDFDRHYDLRIAQRDWEVELTCQSLDWEGQVFPLLSRLNIDSSIIDKTTRELICNPRELALFVELAQRDGSFNVVTSQDLAARHLQVFVQKDVSLGDVAFCAVEAMAEEMLRQRSLSLPPQRFSASQEVKRALLSNNILHETQDGQLTFGHQTLLDVLVISWAVRQGLSLNQFIQDLPPVPFVRPSIRSFVVHLASQGRSALRKQLRSVLTGSAAFHLRRLVAETFAEYPPQDEDWILIRDLRAHHKEVFQVIYSQATGVEWHYFWLKHLVPFLKSLNDIEGLETHTHRIAQWKNEDALGVLNFWTDMLSTPGVEHERLGQNLAHHISEFNEEHIELCGPLVMQLLDLPKHEHSFLGIALARLVTRGTLSDAVLWHFIAGEISESEAVEFHFGHKLHSQPHEFGDKAETFLAERMAASTELLDLAIESIEYWSRARALHYGSTGESFVTYFLGDTSYEDAHSQQEYRHVENERELFDAVEAGILSHARTNSTWWEEYRERLGFNMEGALRYFAILGCTEAVQENLDLIVIMLSDFDWFESSLSFEIGTMIRAAFPHIDYYARERIQANILSLFEESASDPQERRWRILEQSQLILAIPSYLRLPDAQSIIDESESLCWPLERKPRIGSHGGTVRAPFSFEEFLNVSDVSVLRLLSHYSGYRNCFDDLLLGGEREVGWQLREAASRHPSRFMGLISNNWLNIPECFREDLMGGLASYLIYKYGDTRPEANWSPVELPNLSALTRDILDELEKHSEFWHHKRATSKAIRGCAFVLNDVNDSERAARLAMGFSTLCEESAVSGKSVDFLSEGINMAKGDVATALLVMACQNEEKGVPWAASLLRALRRFSKDDNPAVRSVLLRRMPYLQSINAQIGWELFGIIMYENASGLWRFAEPCLYHAYAKQFGRVQVWLDKLKSEGEGKDLETWGRISALAAFSNKLDFSLLLDELKGLGSVDAWSGSASVWSHPDNFYRNREQCLAGLKDGLRFEGHCAIAVAQNFRKLLQDHEPLPLVPIELLQDCLNVLEVAGGSGRQDIIGIDKWLVSISLVDPVHALNAAELYFTFARRMKIYLYDHRKCLTQLLTRLFAHAEELEESDDGELLHRVVVVQDILLALGVSGVDDWLKAAERSLS